MNLALCSSGDSECFACVSSSVFILNFVLMIAEAFIIAFGADEYYVSWSEELEGKDSRVVFILALRKQGMTLRHRDNILFTF